MTRHLAGTPLRLALAAALLAATAGTALAQEEADIFRVHRTEVGAGMLAGGFGVGKVHGAAAGIHINAGRQMGRVKLYAEYDMLSIGQADTVPDAVRGLLHRGGANLRYDVGAIGRDRVQGTFWLEGGAGREWIFWNEGGRLTRDDLSLGFGAQMNFQLGRYEPKPRVLGIFYAFKTTIARAPDADQSAPATCGGPCDEPTRPMPYDLGLYFNVGLQFGR